MGHHAGRRRATTPSTPVVTDSAPNSGRRRAAAPKRSKAWALLPSIPVVAGVAALAVSLGGTLNEVPVTASLTVAEGPAAAAVTNPVGAHVGTTSASSQSLADNRAAVSRGASRSQAAVSDVSKAAESQAKEFTQSLDQASVQAQEQAEFLEQNLWVLPVSGYRITATFGQGGSYWSSVHTGLDFALPSGSSAVAIANGTVTSTGYEGAYGNQLVLTLEDGTEIWYNHLTSFAASVGDTVRAGELIAYTGSTGNSTGPHLHLEVRPGAGDPVDPFAALVAHGIAP